MDKEILKKIETIIDNKLEQHNLSLEKKFQEYIILMKDENLKRNESLIKLILEENEPLNIEKIIRDYIDIGDISSIDFSFVPKKFLRLRKTLFSDNISMEKSRIGGINNTPNFLGFCKYAFFQIEALTNYYCYHKCDGNFDNYLKVFPNSKTYGAANFKQLRFKTNLYSFYQYSKDKRKSFYNNVQTLTDVRNAYLHRSVNSDFLSLNSLTSKKTDLIAKIAEIRNNNEENTQTQLDEIQKQINEISSTMFILNEDYSLVRDQIIFLVDEIKKEIINTN